MSGESEPAPSPGSTYGGMDLRWHVARILTRRDEEVRRAIAAASPEPVELLAADVLHSMKVEFTDHDGAYHGFDPEPFPSARTLVAAIRDYARTLEA
jgi:hypothetical protein